jgi:hypothetical protein
MKVALVTGSRRWDDDAAVRTTLDNYDPDLVIEGQATGADAYAIDWAVAARAACLGPTTTGADRPTSPDPSVTATWSK